MNSPIALFTYNRLKHTKKTIEALAKNKLAETSELFIFSDGPKNEADIQKVKNVREYLKKITGFKKIIVTENVSNFGLAKSIITGVTEIVNKYGKIIVLEDDIVTSPNFLTYMNDALDLYEKDEEVMHISGYFFPVKASLPDTFFYNQTSCWGWATWQRAWKYFNPDTLSLLNEIKSRDSEFEFNVDGSTSSFTDQLERNISGAASTWAIKWDASVFLQHGLCLHPRNSYVKNIGHDGSGTNCGRSNILERFLFNPNYEKISIIDKKESKEARKAMSDFYRNMKPSTLSKMKTKMKKIVKLALKISSKIVDKIKFMALYKKYRGFTMIPKRGFCYNLALVKKFSNIDGCIIECGVWRGGMIAAIADMLDKKRNYYLFDSFEGLPKAEPVDGEDATSWQNDTKSEVFFDNCSAEDKYAEEAMKMSGVEKYSLHKGWFADTLPKFVPESKIAILRLDGDWYKPTMECLENLYKHVAKGGLIILDDYYKWDGCSKAVHDFLSKNSLNDKICQYKGSQLCYIVKK